MKMSKEKAIERAKEIVLSCQTCRIPTDYSFDIITDTWTTVCECGKMSKYKGNFVESEIAQITKEFNVR
jgi:hypothetical protein